VTVSVGGLMRLIPRLGFGLFFLAHIVRAAPLPSMSERAFAGL